MSDENLIKDETKRLENDIKYYEKNIKEKLDNKDKLQKILKEAKEYKVPSSEHIEYKKFMIQQLTDTIKWDCIDDYQKLEIKKLFEQIKNINAEDLRKFRREDILEDLERAKKYLEEETQRVNERNKWVEDVVKSLK